MNGTISKLIKLASETADYPPEQQYIIEPNAAFCKKFAELITKETVDILRKRWYTINNAVPSTTESSRDVGIRVGQKGELIFMIDTITKHFEVEK